MTPENFVYWLQGFLEIEAPKTITEEQIKIINDHISLVLKKETPRYYHGGTLLSDSVTKNDNIFKDQYTYPAASC